MTPLQKKYFKVLIIIHLSLLIFALFFYLIHYLQTLNLIPSFSCFIHQYTGFYCFGCGGTTSFLALLHFQMKDSFISYPAIPITILLLLIYDNSLVLSIAVKNERILKICSFKWFYFIPTIIVISTIWKNILLST